MVSIGRKFDSAGRHEISAFSSSRTAFASTLLRFLSLNEPETTCAHTKRRTATTGGTKKFHVKQTTRLNLSAIRTARRRWTKCSRSERNGGRGRGGGSRSAKSNNSLTDDAVNDAVHFHFKTIPAGNHRLFRAISSGGRHKRAARCLSPPPTPDASAADKINKIRRRTTAGRIT